MENWDMWMVQTLDKTVDYAIRLHNAGFKTYYWKL